RGGALSSSLRRDGPYSIGEAGVGGTACEMETTARNVGGSAHISPRAEGAIGDRHRGLVLASGRESRPARHVFGAGQHPEVRAHRRTSPETAAHHRSHESDG